MCCFVIDVIEALTDWVECFRVFLFDDVQRHLHDDSRTLNNNILKIETTNSIEQQYSIDDVLLYYRIDILNVCTYTHIVCMEIFSLNDISFVWLVRIFCFHELFHRIKRFPQTKSTLHQSIHRADKLELHRKCPTTSTVCVGITIIRIWLQCFHHCCWMTKWSMSHSSRRIVKSMHTKSFCRHAAHSFRYALFT